MKAFLKRHTIEPHDVWVGRHEKTGFDVLVDDFPNHAIENAAAGGDPRRHDTWLASRPPEAELEAKRREIGLAPGESYLLCVAEFRAVKRHEDLLEAFARLPLFTRVVAPSTPTRITVLSERGPVVLRVAAPEDVKARALAAFRGERQGEFILFDSIELLWTVLTPRRWEIIRAMAGRDAMSLRAIARLVGRDVKTVHGDAHALLNAGVLERSDAGFAFPYDAVHVDFTVGKAA